MILMTYFNGRVSSGIEDLTGEYLRNGHVCGGIEPTVDTYSKLRNQLRNINDTNRVSERAEPRVRIVFLSEFYVLRIHYDLTS